jgi:OOP family OmpA-OmpF porin
LQAHFLSGRLSGENKDLSYRTNINYQATLNAVITIGNISFLKKTPRLNVYGFFGFGIINVDPTLTYKRGDSTSVLFKGTNEQITPFGFGLKYRIADKWVIDAGYSFWQSNSDKLDGYIKNLSELDNYSYLNVGISYLIGKKAKPIEWVNPLNTIYADLYDVKDKVDRMTGDGDDDGVADMFDKDPNTPAGVKVYGDGTSVDIDADGVPDFTDTEPFSNKGAKVDASGKELDADADGVPDSEDLEPNTTKGSLVNFQGKTILDDAGNLSSEYNNVNNGGGYFPPIFFDLNSALIKDRFKETIAAMALIMKKNADLKLDIIGNCDTRASAEYNLALGKRRAEAVKTQLVKLYGIEDSRITTDSKGKNDPLTVDHYINRRVDFVVK